VGNTFDPAQPSATRQRVAIRRRGRLASDTDE
jgi:hypothetical protein